jgi:predicted HTH transcriptional regulator
MSEDQLRRIFAEGEPGWLEDYACRGLDAERVVEILDTQTFFELLKWPYPAERRGVLERLQQERLIDFESDGYAIRRLGALLLAKRLEDFPDIARKAPRVVVYSGSSKLETKLDHTVDKGYAVGFLGLIEFIMAQLPQNEVIVGAFRQEVKLVPEVCIRELVANALVHQDFRIGGASVMVEIYADRVDISSPGDPIVPVERFIDGYRSRNGRLAELMRRLALCEEKGSGIDRVIEAAEVFQLPPPDFRKAYQRTSVVLFAPTPFERMDRQARIRACYQHCCLRYVLNRPMSNQTLRDRFKLPESKAESVSRVIRETMAVGKIRLLDPEQTSPRYRSYVPFWA